MRRRREGGGFIVLWGVRVALPGKESEEWEGRTQVETILYLAASWASKQPTCTRVFCLKVVFLVRGMVGWGPSFISLFCIDDVLFFLKHPRIIVWCGWLNKSTHYVLRCLMLMIFYRPADMGLTAWREESDTNKNQHEDPEGSNNQHKRAIPTGSYVTGYHTGAFLVTSIDFPPRLLFPPRSKLHLSATRNEASPSN